MAESNVITETVTTWAKRTGLHRKTSTWYLHHPETIAVVNLQRSPWGPQYYVNVALWLLALEEASFPKAYQCHIGTRLELLLSKCQQSVERLFDLEFSMDDIERSVQITQCLEVTVLPILRAWDTIQHGLASADGRRILDRSLIFGEAYPLLGIELGQRPSPGEWPVPKPESAP